MIKDNDDLMMEEDDLYSPEEQEQLPTQQFEENSSLKEVIVNEDSKSTKELAKQVEILDIKDDFRGSASVEKMINEEIVEPELSQVDNKKSVNTLTGGDLDTNNIEINK